MSVGATQSALRRKLGAGRPPSAVQAMTLARAWRLALVHGFSETAGLVLNMGEHSTHRIEPGDFSAQMEEGDLAILLEGEVGFGVAILDVQLMAALIESQTMGRTLVRPAAPRVPTPTDGAMVADPLDRAFKLFETHAAGLPEAATCFGMRFATPLADGRAVTMALPDETHVLSEITLAFGGADRRGRLRLILPAEVPKAPHVKDDDTGWHDGIERNLLGAQAQLNAVLTRLHLPVERITEFKAGDLVILPSKALGGVALTSCTGSVLARGRLGQSGGNKAVLLDTIPEGETPPALPTPGQAAGGKMTGKPAFGGR